MDALLTDLRFAWRLLRKSPGFTLAAILTLALGIGASTAVFTVVNGVLLRPPPFEHSEQLAFITRSGDVSIPDGEDWRRESRTFQDIALFLRTWAFDLVGEGEPERLVGAVVEPRFFSILGTRPVAGRVFTEEESGQGERVAVISYGLWQRRFGGRADLIGRTVTLSDHSVTIIGVMPPEFDFLHDEVQLWVPAATETPWAMKERGTNNFDAIGRLKPGVTFTEAQADLAGISKRLAELYPRTNAGKIVRPIPLRDFLVGDVRTGLLMLLAAIGLVQLIVCANLASALLARATARQQEIAVRVALGASRARLMRQLLTEGLLLAGLGGTLGVMLALAGSDLMIRLVPAALGQSLSVSVDWRVLVFSAGISILTGLGAGLVPAAKQLSQRALQSGIRAGQDRRQRLTLNVLVSTEVALAALLLIGAGLLIGSFRRLWESNLGFDPSNVLTADLVLPEARYGTKDPQTQAFTRIVEELQRVPGVETAASVIGIPLDGNHSGIGHTIAFEGRPDPEPGQRQGARLRPVVGDYFRALRLPILEGRALLPSDDERAPPVAVVNRAFAEHYFPGVSPVGKRVAWKDAMGPGLGHWMTIVGVIGDVKSRTLDQGDEVCVYLPYVQREDTWQRFGTLVVRARGNPAELSRAVHQAVWAVDPTLALEAVQTLEQRRSGAAASARFNAAALGAFSVAALLLALSGLYAVLSFLVEQRRREIGIRLALGAGPSEVLALVVRRGMILAGWGLAVGLLGAVGLTRLLRGLLYQTSPLDPLTYLSVCAALGIAALGATYLPARRATRVDPLVALRQD